MAEHKGIDEEGGGDSEKGDFQDQITGERKRVHHLEQWLQNEFQIEGVSFVEKRSHGHFLRGTMQGRSMELLVVTSGHVWLKQPSERSWRTTGVYVPDRLIC